MPELRAFPQAFRRVLQLLCGPRDPGNTVCLRPTHGRSVKRLSLLLALVCRLDLTKSFIAKQLDVILKGLE